MRQSPTGRFLGRNEDGSYGIKSKEGLIRKIKKALVIENKRTIENHFIARRQGPDQETITTKK